MQTEFQTAFIISDTANHKHTAPPIPSGKPHCFTRPHNESKSVKWGVGGEIGVLEDARPPKFLAQDTDAYKKSIPDARGLKH